MSITGFVTTLDSLFTMQRAAILPVSNRFVAIVVSFFGKF